MPAISGNRIGCGNASVFHSGSGIYSSAQQQFTNLFRGTLGRLQPPIDDIDTYWTPTEKAKASAMLTCSFVGSRETVRLGVKQFIEQTGVDEVFIVSAIYDHAARLRSYEILADIMSGWDQSMYSTG